jgi:hypothetical protein
VFAQESVNLWPEKVVEFDTHGMTIPNWMATTNQRAAGRGPTAPPT